MLVKIHLQEQSQPIKHCNVTNAYTKGDMYCVLIDDYVFKYPTRNIFRIQESYGKR